MATEILNPGPVIAKLCQCKNCLGVWTDDHILPPIVKDDEIRNPNHAGQCPQCSYAVMYMQSRAAPATEPDLEV